MMRGGNRQMRRMIDKMGVDMRDMPNVEEVIIRTDRKEIIVSNPSVNEMKAGEESTVFMVTSTEGYEEREREVPSFSDDDVELVCTQAGVGRDRAVAALTESKGDLAQAIMAIKAG